MSASLVGSEMCIRDRATSASCACEAAKSVHPEGYSERSVKRRKLLERPCLLYTSDAADDM
eukprot:15362533-Alexandrium_andersonii.AAC.1